MKPLPIVPIAFAAIIATLAPAGAFDNLGHPPAEPAGTVHTPLNQDNIRAELDQRLRDNFTAAAGSSPTMTAQQAQASGWGFIADHFAQIDRDHNGYVTFEQVQAFMDARSPTPPPVRSQATQVIK